MRNLLDDLAALKHTDFRVSLPVSAIRLAHRARLTVRSWDGDNACLVGTEVLVPRGLAKRRRHGVVAHELAHHFLREERLDDTEENADYLGAALLVPASALEIDLIRVGVDLPGLMDVHRNASATLLATRVAEMTGGGASLWHEGRLRWARYRTATALVASIAAHALRERRAVSLGDSTHAWHLGRGYVVALDL